MVHAISGDNPQILYLDFNTIVNKTYILSCMVTYEGMDWDELVVTGVPRVTTTTPGSNTNYMNYGGYLIIPAAGNGDLVVESANMVLIEVLTKEDGTRPAGFWNATFNSSSKQFENITPVP